MSNAALAPAHSALFFVDEIRAAWHDEPRDHRVALVAICIIGLGLRLIHLWQPMRYDESVTVVFFAGLPWKEAMANYTYPNNHILHTLLVKGAIGVFGNTPAVARLPALIAGALVLPATYAAARSLYDSRVALVATALVAVSGGMILYSTNARGYTMITLGFLLLAIIGARLLRGAPPREWLSLAAVAAYGLWTIPVMLYPLGAVLLWLALSLLVVEPRRTVELKRLATAAVVTALITGLLYMPVISRSGVASITRNRFVASTGWYQFLGELPGTFRDALSSWSLGLPLVVSLALAACAVVALARHRSVSAFVVGLPLGAFVWSCWLLAVNHRAPFGRVWIWVVPLAAWLAAAGALMLADRWPRSRALIAARLPALAVAFALAGAVAVVSSRGVLLSTDTGTYRDAPAAARILARAVGADGRILTAIPTNAPLAYYLERAGVPADAMLRDEASAARVIAVVDEAEHQTLAAVTARSAVRDTSVFSPPRLLSRLPSSQLILFERRDAATR